MFSSNDFDRLYVWQPPRVLVRLVAYGPPIISVILCLTFPVARAGTCSVLFYIGPPWTGGASLGRPLRVPDQVWTGDGDRSASAGVPDEVGFATKVPLPPQQCAPGFG